MLTNIFYAVLAVVVSVAILRGGRPERRVALLLVGGCLANGLAQGALGHTVPALAFLVIDTLVALGVLRTVLFRPQAWSGVVLAAQITVMALDLAWFAAWGLASVVYQHAAYALAYLQLGALLTGALARWVGPPLHLTR